MGMKGMDCNKPMGMPKGTKARGKHTGCQHCDDPRFSHAKTDSLGNPLHTPNEDVKDMMGDGMGGDSAGM